MKTMLFTSTLCLFFAQLALSQNEEVSSLCDSLIRTDLDSLNGVYSVSSREDIVILKDGKKTLEFVFLDVDRTLILHVAVVGDNYCLDETNKIKIVFRDGSSLEMLNNGKFNCDGEFSLFFNGGYGRKKELNLLLTKEIERVTVGIRKSMVDKTRKNFVEATIPPEKSKLIMQTLGCLNRQ